MTKKEKSNNSIQALEDLDLIECYLDLNKQLCFDELYRRYSTKIYLRSMMFFKNEAEAHDATQDIFIKIFLNLSKFGSKSKFSTWIYSITYNYCIDRIRKNKKTEFISFPENIPHGDIKEEIEDTFLTQMASEQLKVVLNKLPEGYKQILFMKYRDDLSIKAIGKILQKSDSAIKMNVKRAKEKAKLIHRDLFTKNNDND